MKMGEPPREEEVSEQRIATKSSYIVVNPYQANVIEDPKIQDSTDSGNNVYENKIVRLLNTGADLAKEQRSTTSISNTDACLCSGALKHFNAEKYSDEKLWEEKISRFQSLHIINISSDKIQDVVLDLLGQEEINVSQAIEVIGQLDFESRIKTIFRILFESRQDLAINKFWEALKLQYIWIEEILNAVEGDTELESVTVIMKAHIILHRTTIIDTINPTGYIARAFYDENIITRQIFNEIVHSSTKKIGALHLVTFLLETTDPKAFVLVKEALKRDYLRIFDFNGAASCSEVRKPTKLSLVEIIGEGGYGLVYKAHHTDFGIVAYKKMKFQYIQEFEKDSLREEAELHQKLNHGNIIKCLGVVFEPGDYGIIFELAVHGELRSYLKENNELKIKLQKLHEVASGMNYLHSFKPYPVIHGDLKIQNILVGDNYTAKICDFGFSQWKTYSQSRSVHDVRRGTITHIPPEYWRDSKLRKTVKFDVYSFGICAWEIITLERPFENAEGNEGLIQTWVMQGKRPPIIKKLHESIPLNVLNTISLCWDREVKNRPTFTYIVKNLKPSFFNRWIAIFTRNKIQRKNKIWTDTE